MNLKFILLTFLTLSISFISCDKADELLHPSEWTYTHHDFQIPFYSDGEIHVDDIDWGSDIGEFSLVNPVEGVTVDSQHGIISWDPHLSLHSTELLIKAKNDVGSITTEVVLNHLFHGEFEGLTEFVHSDPENNFTATSLLNFTEAGDLLVKLTSTENEVSEFVGQFTIDEAHDLVGQFTQKDVLEDPISLDFTGKLSLEEDLHPHIIGVFANEDLGFNSNFNIDFVKE